MKRYERPVHFHEVDAAGLVFFPHFLLYAHEAMEAFFDEDEIEEGYPGLIMNRRVGLPAVHIETSHLTPLRFGDRMVVETSVEELGTRSFCFRHDIRRVRDSELAATIKHTAVCTDLDAMKSCDMPGDVRRLLEQHAAGASEA
jgi:4-hydroxybenzoyl-CoA thioesterase